MVPIIIDSDWFIRHQIRARQPPEGEIAIQRLSGHSGLIVGECRNQTPKHGAENCVIGRLLSISPALAGNQRKLKLGNNVRAIDAGGAQFPPQSRQSRE
jgi:hypothetical protein